VGVVTGGGSGIGLAVARRLCQSGRRVVLCGRDAAKLELARRQVLADGGAGGCEGIALDLTETTAPARLIEFAADRFGRIDVLVNSAGVAPLADITAITDQEFDECLAVNVSAVFRATRAVWPVMTRQEEGGVIVNVSSLAAFDPFLGFEVYGACKAWVNRFSETIARQGGPVNIRVFAICLGAVETPLLRRTFPGFPGDETMDPAEVGELVERLCDPAMRHASGQSMRYFKRRRG
jgi:NAD(P)-dependent dehydrogenase (short-subunit alcohol dehydrogenase family)